MKWPKFAKGGRILGQVHNSDSIPVFLSEGCGYYLPRSERHINLLHLIQSRFRDLDSAD